MAHPDLRESDELGTAGEAYARMVLSKLRKGERVVVDELADLPVLDRIVHQGRLVAAKRNAPQAILDNMARYLEEIDALKQSMQMAAQAAAAGPGTAPGAPVGPIPPQAPVAPGI